MEKIIFKRLGKEFLNWALATYGYDIEKGGYFTHNMRYHLRLQVLRRYFYEKYHILICTYTNASGWLWTTMDAPGGTEREWSDMSGPNDSGCWDSEDECLNDGLKQLIKKYLKK